ncbi:MAG: hypothetical protein WDA75_12760 [Candidatus Latescibacterota bacterium]|jgi:hypothetical protein
MAAPRCLPFLLLLVFAGPPAARAGVNAGVELGLAVASPPCGLEAGDLLDFFVAARGMSQVRQVKMVLSWQPEDAVASVTGTTDQQGFIIPGPPLVDGNRAEFGMATFGTGIEGEGILARFGLTLAEGITADNPAEIRLETVSLGPSSSERDTLAVPGLMVLANYCDDSDQPVSRGLFLRPRAAAAGFSSEASASQYDESSGELFLNARLLDDGTFRTGQRITWTLDNRGTGPIWVLTAEGPQPIDPGDTLLGGSETDDRGETVLLFDAAPGALLGNGALEVTACGEVAGQPYCDAARLTWTGVPTAVTEVETAVLPGKPTLGPCYPNPFNATTVIPVTVPAQGTELVVEVLDLLARPVARLHAGPAPAGLLHLSWDGRDDQGRLSASGVYLCRAHTATWQAVRSMTLAR